MANINKIKLSGTTYNIQDLSAAKSVELTQAQYDALTVKDPNTFYVITDAQGADLSNYYTKSETSGATEISTALASKADTATTYTKTEVDNAITAATSTKQDTLVSGTNIKTINNESILGSGNIEVQGGGKAIEAGRGISITTGETADTVSFDLPISSSTETLLLTDSSNSISDTNSVVVIGASNNVSSTIPSRPTVKSIILGFSNEIVSTSIQEAKREKNYIIGNNNSVKGGKNVVIGANNIGYNSTTKTASSSYIVGDSNSLNCGDVIDKENNYIFGSNNKVYNSNEVSIGYYNNSVSDGTTSGNTFFSVGNGTADNARHNAFEIRQNGDIYLSLNGQDVKLQDQLGGGGGGTSYTAGDGIDITNNVISVTGKVDTSAITTSITSSSTDAQVPSAKAVNDKLGGLSLVKLTQAEYDALVTKDNSTLYVIVN